MPDRFRIFKENDTWRPWNLDYPDGFVGDSTVGECWNTFEEAVAAFIRRSEQQCPICQRGAVVDTDWGWKCENCGSFDIAVGCVGPSEGQAHA